MSSTIEAAGSSFFWRLYKPEPSPMRNPVFASADPGRTEASTHRYSLSEKPSLDTRGGPNFLYWLVKAHAVWTEFRFSSAKLVARHFIYLRRCTIALPLFSEDALEPRTGAKPKQSFLAKFSEDGRRRKAWISDIFFLKISGGNLRSLQELCWYFSFLQRSCS